MLKHIITFLTPYATEYLGIVLQRRPRQVLGLMLGAVVADIFLHTPAVTYQLCNTQVVLAVLPCSQHIVPPKFNELVKIQDEITKVLDEVDFDAPFIYYMWDLELAVRDLNTVIKSSDITDGEILSSSFDEMIPKIKKASELLHQLDHGVGWTVDAVLAEDASALLSLEQVDQEQQSISLYRKSSHRVEQELKEIFLDMLGVVETGLQTVIEVAAIAKNHIDDLDANVLMSSNIAAKATKKTRKAQGEELASLWTVVSGKGAKIKNFENHEDILNKVDSVLEEAKIRLSLITHHLQALHPALHKLREEVTKPMLVPQLRNKLLLSDHRKGLEEAKEKLGRKRKEVKAKKEEIQQKMREFRERRPLSMKPLELPQM